MHGIKSYDDITQKAQTKKRIGELLNVIKERRKTVFGHHKLGNNRSLWREWKKHLNMSKFEQSPFILIFCISGQRHNFFLEKISKIDKNLVRGKSYREFFIS